MKSLIPGRDTCAAVLLPGLLTGIILWACIWAGDTLAMLPGTRADRFMVTSFIIAPILIAGAGALAGILRGQGRPGTSVLRVSYAAGFLAAFTAISLMLILTGIDQQLPQNPMGTPAGPGWSIARFLFCLPLVLPASAIFGAFSLPVSVILQGRGAGKNGSR